MEEGTVGRDREGSGTELGWFRLTIDHPRSPRERPNPPIVHVFRWCRCGSESKFDKDGSND
jgi:hypothetical protein